MHVLICYHYCCYFTQHGDADAVQAEAEEDIGYSIVELPAGTSLAVSVITASFNTWFALAVYSSMCRFVSVHWSHSTTLQRIVLSGDSGQ
jgi:hypothetical protein